MMVMRVLDRTDVHALARQVLNEFNNQGRLAAVLAANDMDSVHLHQLNRTDRITEPMGSPYVGSIELLTNRLN